MESTKGRHLRGGRGATNTYCKNIGRKKTSMSSDLMVANEERKAEQVRQGRRQWCASGSGRIRNYLQVRMRIRN
jgi:hypothetical protein